MSRLRFVAEQNLGLRLVLSDHGECVLADQRAKRMEERRDVADIDLVKRIIDCLDYSQHRDQTFLQLKLAIRSSVASVNTVSQHQLVFSKPITYNILILLEVTGYLDISNILQPLNWFEEIR